MADLVTSGTQVRRPRTLLERATDGDAWTEDPTGTAASALGCLLTFPGCIGADLWSRSREYREEAERRTVETIALVQSAGGYALSEGGPLENLFDASVRPMEEASNIAMWGAIAVIAIAVIVVVLAGLYVTRGLF